MEQEDKAAAGLYKIKKSKVEQEDRAAAGVIRLRRVKWNMKSSSRDNKIKQS